MYLIVAVIYIGLFHTRWGLRVRAVGEHPKAADTLGINVLRTRYVNVLLGGAVAGMGGAFFTLVQSSSFSREMTAGMGQPGSGGGSSDPMDIPRAIAEIIALPRGERPLRRAVHPGNKPQEGINAVSRETQLAMLGNSPWGPVVRDVHD
jgi:hypothetical protein